MQLLPSVVVVAATLVARVIAAPTAESSASSFKYTFPALSGPYCVGKTSEMVLTDYSRKDTFANDSSAPRQVLLTIYYPTKKASPYQDCPGEAYASPGFAGWISNFLSGNVSADYFRKFRTHSVTNAPYYDSTYGGDGKHKPQLLLYSHGFNVPAKLNQVLVEDMTSHGYIIAFIEHPWDSDYAEFPDGHVVRTPAIFFQQPDIYRLGLPNNEIRINDTLFILDSIKSGKAKIRNGPDIRRLTDCCGMFGHSVGGQQSLGVMLRTQRVRAGVNMDGWFWGAANATSLKNPHEANAKRPYMTLRQDPKLLTDFFLTTGGGPQNYVDAMKVQTGPKIMPLVTGVQHYGYTDLTALRMPAYDAGGSMKKEEDAFQVWTGPINPHRMHKISTSYHSWFFDNTVKGGHAVIKRGLSGFPEVTLADNIGN